MDLPFTAAEFLHVFRSYNQAVWPAQLFWFGVALTAVLAVRRGVRRATRAMFIVLAGLWLWMGVVYHGVFFREINPAALLFAALFMVQGGLLLYYAARDQVIIRPERSHAGIIGWMIVGYGLALYPLLGIALGHRYPASPTFGLPCPTTLYTLGVLLWVKPLRWSLFLLPLAWAVVGTVAALQLGIYEDLGLAAAGVLVLAVLVASHHATIVQASAA